MGFNHIAGSHFGGLARRALGAVLTAGFSLGMVATAQAFEVTEAQREACTPDAFRLCSAEIPDANRVAACMQANVAQLSPPCRAVFQTADMENAPPPAAAPRLRKVTYRHTAHSRRYAREHEHHHHRWARSDG